VAEGRDRGLGSPTDPQIYGDLEIDAGALLDFIEDARARSGVRLTVTHVVGKAVAHALGEHPELNTYLSRGRFVEHESVDVFFVVAVEDGRDLSGVKVRGADRSRSSRSRKSSRDASRRSAAETTSTTAGRSEWSTEPRSRCSASGSSSRTGSRETAGST
jgi:pyruvate dehydrogenase E2 component (dihydrolipoamide acetyltransferase)